MSRSVDDFGRIEVKFTCLSDKEALRALLPEGVNVENRLRLLRAARNWSQQDLAGRLEVSRQSVNAIETGKYDPSLPLAFRIAELFDRSIEDIFVSPSRRSSKAI